MLIIWRGAEDAKDKYIKNENDPREPIVLDYVHVQDTFLHRKDKVKWTLQYGITHSGK